MNDKELVVAFERAELSGEEFSHVEHVRVAWWYLTRHPFDETRQRFSDALRRFAAAKGKAERYHETITVAYLVLIAERLCRTPDLTWSEFAARHADLLARQPPVLALHYSDETLKSRRARDEFVLPDRRPLPVALEAIAGVIPGAPARLRERHSARSAWMGSTPAARSAGANAAASASARRTAPEAT